MVATNPTTIVIFGATGDLFRKKLAPALFNLHLSGELPMVFRIVAFSRRPWGDEEFRKFFGETLAEKSPNASGEVLKKFLEHVFYTEGDLENADSYSKLSGLLAKFDKEQSVCMNKLFYLATPPNFYETILKHISDSGLAIPCAPTKDGGETGWTRILIEKPFGSDLENARRLDALLGKLFSENQIFRIDHYLAKETLQHILKFRFSEGLFEPFWNGDYIEEVSVVFLEREGVGGRGAFYDSLGALRDVGQNHCLQMTALVAMEKPENFSAEAIRAKRAGVLKDFKIFGDDISTTAIRAQYEGYQDEKGVAKNSATETYFKIKLALSGKRFRGIPFILEAGKGLSESKVEIKVSFKKPVEVPVAGKLILAEAVKFKIQPKEEISIICPSCAPDEISFPTDKIANGERKIDAYEKVLLDAVLGDQTLFTSTDEVVAEWNIIMPILLAWRKVVTPLLTYAKGEMPKN